MLTFIFFTVIFCSPFLLYAEENGTDYDESTPGLYQAASVLVMCAETGEVIYETEGRTLRYPASITKVMTALLVLEYAESLDEPVVVSAYALDIPDYASRIWMNEGESITVLEALYGIMLSSCNEIARALAEYAGGTVAQFVRRMNERAHQLGAVNTHFVNPCGLPGDGQFTTAYDIAVIMQAAIQHPVFVEIISTPYFEMPPTNRYRNPRSLRNTNRMIRPGEAAYNPYAIGGKTGFTNAAQHTLVSYVRKGSRRMILTVLYSSPRGAIFSDTAALIDYVYVVWAETERQRELEAAAAEEAERVRAEEQELIAAMLEEQEYQPEYVPGRLRYVPYEESANRRIFLVVGASLITFILGLLCVNAIRRRRRRRRYWY